MSRFSLNSCLLACLLVTISGATTAAQEREIAPPPEYVIEVDGGNGCTFAPVKKQNYSAQQLIVATIASPKIDREGKPAVSTVTVSARLEDELWRVGVVVGRGEFYDAGDQQVVAFNARTNERVEVRDLVRFGLNPFRVGVLKVLNQAARRPYATNRTESLSVEKLEAGQLPEPFRIFVKNNSEKNVLAVQYNTYKMGDMTHLKWLAGERSRPLIKPGDVYRLDVPSEDRTCGGEGGYRPVQSNRIEIASVVFTDGSYEGDQGLAVLMRSIALGNTKHLRRIVETLNAWSQREYLTAAEVAAELRAQVAAMDETAEPYMLSNLQMNFPSLTQESFAALSNFVRYGQHGIRTGVLDDVLKLEKAAGRDDELKEVQTWLARAKKKYERWLKASETTTGQ